MTPDQVAALDVARELCRAGVPFFLGKPDGAGGHQLPLRWQRVEPDLSVIDAWEPGWALCMVTGHGLDLIDVDPRSGGITPDVPHLGQAATPSGGTHLFVTSLGVESLDGGGGPGVDVKSGTADGQGRGFAYVAPTVRLSKVTGAPEPYRWVKAPMAGPMRDARNYTAGHGVHGALAEVRAAVLERRAGRASASGERRRVPRSVAAREWGDALQRLVADVQHWRANGWAGEAHVGLLAHARHLVMLAPDHAEVAYVSCFRAAGVEPDAADMAKLHSAVEKYAGQCDVVVEDADLGPNEAFWMGADGPVVPPFEPAAAAAELPAAPGLAERAGREAFDFYTQAELRAFDAPDAVVEGLLLAATVSRMFGPSNVGKTWVAIDIGAHVANGMPWQGHMVKPGPVVYVYAEGATGSSARMDAWSLEHGRDTGILTWPEAVEIGGPRWAEFVAKVVERKPALVLLDTLKACALTSKENDNDDMAKVMAHARVLAEASGACVLLVHHNGWAADGRARGASAAIAALDTELELAEGEGGVILLLTRKQRHIAKGKPLPLRLVPAHGMVVVAGLTDRVGGSTDDFFAEDPAGALFEALRAHEDAGWTPPAQLGVRELVRVLRQELNRKGSDAVMRRAVLLFKAHKGQPVELDHSE